MKRIRIGRGTEFLLRGRKYEITQEIEKDVFLARDLEFETVEEKFSHLQLLQLLSEGQLEFSVRNKINSTNKPGIYEVQDFSMLPSDKREEAYQRLEAIEPLLQLNVNSLNSYIDARCTQLYKKGFDVSKQTLYRWIKAYKESDGDIYSLVSNTHKRGVKDSKLDKEVDMIIDNIINENFLVREARTITTIYELVHHEINVMNEKREFNEKLKIPSLSTIRRRILARDPSEVVKARNGAAAFRSRFKQVQHHDKPKYPLQRVEVDHTQLDLMVLDDKTLLPIGRPTITSVLDVYTGYPLGVYIGFEPPGYTSVMLALLSAVNPKESLKKKFPKIKNDWVAFGLPEVLVVDNGKEFLSKHLKEACSQLRIDVINCPVKMPWYKGAIERHFRTLNQELLHQTPGTTFSNVLVKGDYDPEKNACIKFSELLELFYKWLLDYYCIKHNKGVKGAPARLWNKWFENNPRPDAPKNNLDWAIALMKVGYGSIQSTGIRKHYLFYQSPELFLLKDKLERVDKKNKVKYKYDPINLDKIYVYDEIDDRFIEVFCTDLTYTEGLNEYAHKVLVRKTREEEKNFDMDALAASKAEIIQMMKDAKANTIKERKQIQRLNNIGSNKVLSEEPVKSLTDLEVTESKKIKEEKAPFEQNFPDVPGVSEVPKSTPDKKMEAEFDMFYIDIENDWSGFDD